MPRSFARYGKDGHMHSISRTEERTQHYDLPCQGKYHRHQFIEIFYVMEGSFEQILLGEKRCFFKGEVVITDQNCEHADYLEEVDATVLFLWLKPPFWTKSSKATRSGTICTASCSMPWKNRNGSRAFWN